MRHIDLFTGIGGFALAAKEVWEESYENVCFCDINKFTQAVIRKNFGEGVRIYDDIRNVSRERLIADRDRDRCTGRKEEVITAEAGEQAQREPEGCCERITADTNRTGSGSSEGGAVKDRQESSEERKHALGRPGRPFTVDLLTGGFPCQPFSQAGKRKGTSDDRHLWPEMLRVIKETKPRWVIGENVRGLVSIDNGMVLEQVCLDLEGEGYAVQPFIIPAVAVNAPHRRDRIWIVAHSTDSRRGGGGGEERGVEERELQPEERGRRALRGKGKGRYSDDSNPKSERRLYRSAGQQQQTPSGQTLSGWSYTRDCSDTDPERRRCEESRRTTTTTGYLEDCRSAWERSWLDVAHETCSDFHRMDDGLSIELDGRKLSAKGQRIERLKACGNAIVPQVAVEIMKAIKFADSNEQLEETVTNLKAEVLYHPKATKSLQDKVRLLKYTDDELRFILKGLNEMDKVRTSITIRKKKPEQMDFLKNS